MKDIITVEDVLSWSPCEQYPEPVVRDIIGDGLTPLQLANHGSLADRDKNWVLNRSQVFTEDELWLLASNMPDHADECHRPYGAEHYCQACAIASGFTAAVGAITSYLESL